MIKLQITGKTKSEAIQAATSLRETLGKRVDFGISRTGKDGEAIINGYLLTPEELDELRKTGDPSPDPNFLEIGD